MNNIDIIIQDGYTPSKTHLILFRFKINDLYCTDTVLGWFNSETCKLEGLSYSVDITNFYNITEEEYFMQSLNWKSNIPLSAAIKAAQMANDYFKNKSYNINDIVTIEY